MNAPICEECKAPCALEYYDHTEITRDACTAVKTSTRRTLCPPCYKDTK